MVTFTAHASSSHGNLYRITDGGSSMLLECGLPIKKLRQAIGHNLHAMDGVLVSHEHMDHAKAAQDVIKAGVDVFCSRGTAGALGLTGHRVKIVRAREQFKIGSWIVLPFELEHDAAEPLGFLIQAGAEKVLFAPDTFYIRYRFKGLTHIMIECNYSKETLSDEIPPAQFKRLIRSHMSLETLLGFLSANDLSAVREIHLLHLSDDNSDEALFKEMVQGNTGIPVYVAKK